MNTEKLWKSTSEKYGSTLTNTHSKPMRDFHGFDTVPDEGKFTRFKQDFCDDLKAMFDDLVELTELSNIFSNKY
jgi:hypothetical protein